MFKQPGSVRRLRVFTATSIAALLLLAVAAWSGAGVIRAQAHRLAQDPTAYPVESPTLSEPYPYPIETDDDFEPFPTAQGTTPFVQPTLQFTPTPLQSITAPPNAFLTENAEMGGSQVTQPAQALTPASTVTLTPTRAPDTPQPTPILADGQGGSGRLNWGLFWIGFSLPVLAACGWVLYLLDRRPELFRSRG